MNNIDKTDLRSKATHDSTFEAEVERIAALPIEEVRASLHQAGIEPTKTLPIYLSELYAKPPTPRAQTSEEDGTVLALGGTALNTGAGVAVSSYESNLKSTAYDLVCLSHLRWDFVYQRPQHLLTRFANARRVFFVEEPLSGDWQPHLDITPRGDGLHVVVPRVPQGLGARAVEDVQKRLTDQLFEECRIDDHVLWYYTPMALAWTRHLKPLATVYDCMDELSAFRGAPPALREREAELFRRADLVFTGGQSLYEAKRDRHHAVYAFPSSIDHEHFGRARQATAEPEDQAGIPHPRLGFFGVVDERFDLELLGSLSRERPDWHFVIIGPVVKIDPEVLPRAANVHYLGGKSYKDLPSYLAGWDVATLLFARNEHTRFINPTKTAEYLAAGKPVVSTSIRDVVRPYGELGLVRIADDAPSFVAAAEELMQAGADPDWLARVDALLAQNTWDQMWARMSELIGGVAGRSLAARASGSLGRPVNAKVVSSAKIVSSPGGKGQTVESPKATRAGCMLAPSLVHLLRERAEELPATHSYTFLLRDGETETLTFSQLYRRACAIAARLQQLRVHGERAMLLYPPGMDYITAFYGCLTAGSVAVPAYPPRMNRSIERLESILKDAAPRAVLTTAAIYGQLKRHFEKSPHLARLDWVVTDEVADAEADAWVDPQVNEDTLAFLQYTSGSTAAPKGVMITHGNILHNESLIRRAFRQTEESVIVGWLPLYHDMGLIGNVLQPLYVGGTCVLMSPVAFLQRPARWLQAITRFRATTSGGPNFAYDLCVRKVTEEERAALDLSTWTVAFNGAEPVRAETLERFAETFGPCGFRREAFYPCYGLAEATLFVAGGAEPREPVVGAFDAAALEKGIAADADAETEDARHLISCGESQPGQSLFIVDPETATPCVDGEVGEIWVAGPSVAAGYWNRPDETVQTFHARLAGADAGPFLRTGDLGFMRGGELFITGRLKDLIILYGRNLYPHDIERMVERSHPSLRPGCGAAFSVEADGVERLVVAAEVRREARNSTDIYSLVGHIRAALASECAVDVSAVVLLRPNTLPKTSSGKTQRSKVRQGFIDGTLEVLTEWRDEAVFGGGEKATPAAQGWEPGRMEDWPAKSIAAYTKLTPERVNRDRALHYYGVDSVIAIALVYEVEETFGLEPLSTSM